MVFKLIIESEAKKEIHNAIHWYEKQQKGLGADFFNYLDGYFKTMKSGKAVFSIKRKPAFRELPLKRFPFIIIYELLETEIIIYSVFSTHQHPHKKIK